jgi:glycosyl transferase family 25
MAARIETFVIHLGRATGRRVQVDGLLAASPYPARALDAVDGRALSHEMVGSVYSREPIFTPRYPFVLRDAEVGAFLSHRAGWQQIVDENLAAALILEDDVGITDGFLAAVRFAADHVEQYGYIQFQVRPVKDSDCVQQRGPMKLVQPKVTLVRMSAQLVSHKAAQQLLEATKVFDRPVDTFLQMFWETGIKPVCVVPSGVEDRSAQTGGSTISQPRSIWDKMLRAVQRGIYRSKIARLSAVDRGDTR